MHVRTYKDIYVLGAQEHKSDSLVASKYCCRVRATYSLLRVAVVKYVHLANYRAGELPMLSMGNSLATRCCCCRLRYQTCIKRAPNVHHMSSGHDAVSL